MSVRTRLLAAACTAAAAVSAASCGGSEGGVETGPVVGSAETEPGGEPGREASSPPRRTVGPRLRLERIGAFNRPLGVIQAPGDRRRLFVLEKGGRVRVVRDGRKLRRPFLSVRGEVSDRTEQGLLGLAFAPDYEQSRRLYVSYTDLRGRLVVMSYRAQSPDRAPRRGRRLVFRLRQPEPTHQGGHLAFGPDGMLYLGLGDGGGPGDPRRNGQDRSNPYGTIIRIDPSRGGRKRYGRYAIPSDNPFRDVRGARPEIAAYGLRNPWRFSFDRETGAILIGDVGQEGREEVNYRPAHRILGANFGWSAYEGTLRFNRRVRAPRNHTPPIHEYGREFGCSVTGGVVMRDPEVPSMEGRYVYSDFCSGVVKSLVPRAPRALAVRSEQLRVRAPSAFGEDLDGRVYVASLDGPVYRLAPS